jgi:hypothetical protein
MYKEISFRSVSKPGRITAPGFVLGAIRRRCGTAAAPTTALRATQELRNSIVLAPVFKAAERSVFLLGFAKSDQDNIDTRELRILRRAAAEMLSWSEKEIAAMLATGAWTEIDWP